QTLSYCGRFPLDSLLAASKSTSAFLTHSRVSFFIKDFASRHDLPHKPFALVEPLLPSFRRTDKEVQGKWRIASQLDPNGLIKLVAGGHDHEDIHVAVGVRPAVGLRAEEDDLVGPELLGHLTGEAADDAHGDARAAVPAGRLLLRRRGALLRHDNILP